MPGYMFIDDEDDVIVMPVQKIEYKKSSNCKFSCISSQICNSCDCEDRLQKTNKRIDELKDLMRPYEKNVVSFGKFKGVGWKHMFNGNSVSSWSHWYIKNCTNKNEFYTFLILLEEYEDLQSQANRIRNPNYD